jgi:hypothetical protein
MVPTAWFCDGGAPTAFELNEDWNTVVEAQPVNNRRKPSALKRTMRFMVVLSAGGLFGLRILVFNDK